MDAFTHIVTAVLSFLAGFSVKVVIDRRKTDKSSNTVVQEGNQVGGNVAGRDVNASRRD